MSTRSHFVYEAYDADGLLLYVGCTGRPKRRVAQHLSASADARGWFGPFVTEWKFYGPYEESAALALERHKILTQHPIWNGQNPANRKGRRLIREYLQFHQVHFERDPKRSNGTVLVKGRRPLKAVFTS